MILPLIHLKVNLQRIKNTGMGHSSGENLEMYIKANMIWMIVKVLGK